MAATTWIMTGAGAARNLALSGVTVASPEMLRNRTTPPRVGTMLNASSSAGIFQSAFVSFFFMGGFLSGDL